MDFSGESVPLMITYNFGQDKRALRWESYRAKPKAQEYEKTEIDNMFEIKEIDPSET